MKKRYDIIFRFANSIDIHSIITDDVSDIDLVRELIYQDKTVDWAFYVDRYTNEEFDLK